MSQVRVPASDAASSYLGASLGSLGVALLYWLLAQPSQALAFTEVGVSPFWPPAGIALAFLYQTRLRCWPGVFIGAFVVDFQLITGSDLGLDARLFSATGMAFGSVLEGLLGVFFLRHFLGPRAPLDSLRGFTVFLFLAVVLGSLLGGLVGVSTMSLFELERTHDFLVLWRIWWLGDLTGALLFAPLCLALFDLRLEGLSYRRLLGALLLFTILGLACVVTFGLLDLPGRNALERPVLLMPLMIWAVIRLRLMGAALALNLVVGLALLSALQGRGVVVPDLSTDSLLLMQLLALIVSATLYSLAAVLNERDALAMQLRTQNAGLTALVDERAQRLAESNEALRHEAAERQQVAWELSASEEKLRLILELATESIVLVDADTGRIVECNRVAHERLGYSREEFMSMSISEFEAVEDAKQVRLHIEKIRSEGYDRFETVHRSKDGTVRDSMISVRYISLRDHDYLLATFSDITELKKSERLLVESERKHRLLIESLQEGIWALDADGVTSFVNARMAQMLGYGAAEMLGRHLFQFMAPDKVDEAKRNLRRRATGVREEHEFEFLRRDGTPLLAHLATSPIYDEQGQYAGAIAGIMDIGHLKRIETSLRESEQRLLQVIDLVPHWLFARDGRGRYLLANRAMGEALGLPTSAILGKSLHELQIDGADEGESLAEDREVLASGAPKSMPQVLFVDRQGRERVMQTTKIPFTQIGSSEPAVLGIAIDITEQRRADQLMAGRNLILELMARGVPLKLVLDELLRLYESLYPELYCSILLLDTAHNYLSDGVSPRLPEAFMAAIDRMPVGEGVGCCGHAVWSGELAVATDIREQAETTGFVESTQRFGLRSCWSLPIRSAFGPIYGTFAAYRTEPGQPTDEQLTVMKSLGQMAALAIDRRQRELVLTRLKHAVDRSGSMVLITDTERRIEYVNQRLCEVSGYASEEMLGELPQIFRATDMPDEVYENVWSALARGEDWRGELQVQTRQGEVIWVVMSISPVHDETGKPVNYVFVCEDVTAIKQAHDEMQQLAFHDTLTGLENRRLFKERLDHAVHVCARSHQAAALLFLDLDNFKGVNDTLGHEAGDKLLQVVAQRLLGCVRQEDCVARLGGDEFTVLLMEVGSEAGAEIAANKIIESLCRPIVLGENTVRTSTSIGIALLPRDGGDSTTLMKNADAAMYQAKSAGRNTFRFCPAAK